MGNYRFRLSDIFKPKDMSNRCQTCATGKASATAPPPPLQLQPPNRASCYYIQDKESKEKLPHSPVNTKSSDTHFPIEPTRKAKQKGPRIARKPCAHAVSSAVSATCTCHRTPATPAAVAIRDVGNDRRDPTSASNSSESDIFHPSLLINFEELDAVLQHKLPPVVTKPEKKELQRTGGRRSIKVRHNSPRIGSKKVQAYRKHNTAALPKRKPLRDSFVMIKSSSNPWRDFEESMLEMIVENNIQEADDLEELLACYLSLNAKEYHQVIVEVFARILFVLTDVPM